MAIRLHISLCGFLLALSRVIYASTSNNITLTPTNSQVSFRFNSSEPFCDSPPCTCDLSGLCDYTCDIYVTSPPGTILNTIFLALHIPEDDMMTVINLNTSEELVRISWISLVIDPIYLDSSQMKITFDRCDGSSPYSYLEAEFSFTDQLQDSFVRSSGGAFALSGTYPSITIQSVNLSSLTDVAAQLHWFITASSYTWIQVDILDMNPGEGGEVCIFDTFDTYGEWLCMRDTVSSTTWYSYDDEIRMSFYVNGNNQPGAGLTVKLSIVDHSTWNGQFLTLAACNPNVIVQEVETIRFVTPYFNQSLENVRYQCRMSFTNGDPLQPTSLEYNHFDVPGEVSVFTVESGQFVNLADATDIKVDISPDSPIVSISPTHELIVDVNTGKYKGTGIGMMVQPYTGDIASRGPEPMSSFGVAIELDDTSYLQEFTTLGYPTLPEGDINIRWLLDKPITGTAIKVEFIDFDIGAATLFGHIAETDPPPWQFTGSTLPDDIRTETQRLTLLLRSDNVGCKRGIHFNVTLIILNNECANSPCNNGGTCYDDLESFRCICPTGYIGDLCQNLITTAGSSPKTSPQSSTTDASTRVPSTQERSTSKSTARSEPLFSTLSPIKDNSNNVLIITLSTCLIIAFLLITFLVCMVVYRSGKQARGASRTNPEFCSQNDLIPANNSTHRYQEGPGSNINHQYMSAENTATSVYPPPLPPDWPPEYETIPPLKEGGAHGGDYLELDSSAIGGGDYEKLREEKAHSPGTVVHQNPPEYSSIIIPVGPAQNRDSQYSHDYIEPISSIPMSGTTSIPSGVNPEQTTTFHK